MRLVVVDTETGGLNPEATSLLTIALVAWEKNRILGKREIRVKENIMRVSPSALEINRINLNQHVKKAVSPKEACVQILGFCEKYLGHERPWSVAGHNVAFDVGFLRHLFEAHGYTYYEHFSHRVLDTASVLRFLYLAGVLERDLSSSDTAFEYFKITPKRRHSALGDALATAELISSLVSLVRSA